MPLLSALLLASTAQPSLERIDHYFHQPRRVEAVRALSGLGDPGLETVNYGNYRRYEDDEKALLAQMMPPREPQEGYWYPQLGDCRVDYALRIARQRIENLGPSHLYVQHWMRVQRAVFSACRGDKLVGLPPPFAGARGKLALVQANDRAYQTASLLFYLRSKKAKGAFLKIAASRSPHAPIAHYMALVSDLPDTRGLWDDKLEARLAKAKTTILPGARAILADPKLESIHPLTQGLIGWLGYSSRDPDVRRAQIHLTVQALKTPLRHLANPAAGERYTRAADDIEFLIRASDKPDWWLTGAIPRDETANRALAAEARHDRFAELLLFPQSPFEQWPWITARRIVAETSWRRLDRHARRRIAQGGGLPWKVIRASLRDRYDERDWRRIDAFLQEAKTHPKLANQAALPMLFFHQVRTALLYPQGKEQLAAFAMVMRHARSWPWKDSQHFQSTMLETLRYLAATGRISEARALRDAGFVRRNDYEAAQVLMLLAADENELVAQLRVRPDLGESLLNQLSIAALTQLASRRDLPIELRARFARVAWTRHYALGGSVPLRLDRLMRALNPEITMGWNSRLGAGPEDRLLLLDVLRSPGLNILITDHQRKPTPDPYSQPGLRAIDTLEHSDNNWWCAWQPAIQQATASQSLNGTFFGEYAWQSSRSEPSWYRTAATPDALNPLLRKSWLWNGRNLAEQQALSRIVSAPKLLSERAIDWTRHPGFFGRRAGRDMALALSVRATRYGCQRQGGHGAYSQVAFRLLHSRFSAVAADANMKRKRPRRRLR